MIITSETERMMQNTGVTPQLGVARAGLASRPDRAIAVLLCCATLVSLPLVFFTAFNQMAWFDDEGTLMVGFKSMADGHRMYDDIYSLYGPFYNELYGLLYNGFHIPLTHTAARLLSAFHWLAFTACFAAVSYGMTGSRTVAVICYGLVLLWLSDLIHSPGHPQELCLLLTGLLMLCVSRIAQAPTAGSVAMAAGLVAGLALVKINIGVFAGGSLAVIWLRNTMPSRWAAVLPAAVIAGLAMMPFVLASALFDLEWAHLYALASSLTILAAGGSILAASPSRPLLKAHWFAASIGAGITCVVILGVALLAGSSLHALLDAIILQNAHFIRNWYIALWGSRIGVVSALLSGGLAVAYWVSARSTSRFTRSELVLVCAKAAFVAASLMLLVSAPLLFLILAPLCWLLTVPPAHVPPERVLSRQFAGVFGAVMFFYAFPVAGGQLAIATFIPIIAIPVFAYDLHAWLQIKGVTILRLPDARLALASAIILLFVASATAKAGRAYEAGVPLDLPGTALIRLPQKQVATLRWVTAQLAGCGSSYSLPGLFSFAFWTGQPLLTLLNVNDTLAFIKPEQQVTIVRALRDAPDLCVLYDAKLLKFLDRGQIATDPPLLHYVQNEFEQVGSRGDYAILKRKPGHH